MSKRARKTVNRRQSRLDIFEEQRDRGFPVVVAEGDSWFDYPFPPSNARFTRRDVLDFLMVDHNYAIKRVSRMGDTLENMAHNTLGRTLAAVRDFRPVFFLFSAGGNDLAGPELLRFLNHAGSGLPLIREEEYRRFLQETVRPSYEKVIHSVLDEHPTVEIFGHGYDYVEPNGEAVIEILWASFVGPWLEPTFRARGVEDIETMRRSVAWFVDRFNELLVELDAAIPAFHYADLRGTVPQDEWPNEIHPSPRGFSMLADKFAAVMQPFRERLAEG